jgi:hypothetical protein
LKDCRHRALLGSQLERLPNPAKSRFRRIFIRRPTTSPEFFSLTTPSCAFSGRENAAYPVVRTTSLSPFRSLSLRVPRCQKGLITFKSFLRVVLASCYEDAIFCLER